MISSSSGGFDSVISEAWNALQDADHKAEAYSRRATQLTKWKRLRDFVSLGVAPSFLIAPTIWENTVLRILLIAFSGICSLASWLWVIFGLSYSWDNQLRVSLDAPPQLKEIIAEMKENIEIYVSAKNSGNTSEASNAISRLRVSIDRINSIRQEIQREQVYAAPWMNLMATQHSMQFCNAKCGSCYQFWIPGSEIFNSDKAKRFLKRAAKGKLSGVCEVCGQRLPAQRP